MLDVQGLTLAVPGKVLLKSTSFEIEEGDCSLWLGPNGIGKTSLFKAFLGLMAYRGNIRWNDHDLRDLSAKQRARIFGYVPQTVPILFSIRAIDLVKAGRFSFQEGEGEQTAQAMNFLERTQAHHLAMKSLPELSGGELQRVVLASALAQQPQILLLDEPANHLDPYYRSQLVELLIQLKQEGMTLCIISHDHHLFESLDPTFALFKNHTVEIRRPLDPHIFEELYTPQDAL